MNLLTLLKDIKFSSNLADIQITGITSDSRQLEKGNIYVCIKGLQFDGHEYAPKALENGACAVVVDHNLGLENQIIVENTRIAYGKMCSAYFGNPSKKLKMIAVTGTNGKSTCVFLIKQILERMGKKVGLMGTIHNEIGDIILPTKNTTPDAFSLHSMLSRMVKAGCEYAVMEASSHALDQYRLAGIDFEVGIFTNLTVDHLDYHLTMENYFQAKKKLFDVCKKAIINLDDEYGRRLAQEYSEKTLTYSIDNDEADYTAKNVNSTSSGSTFAFVGDSIISRIKITMPGDYSVSNAMATAACCLNLGATIEDVALGLENSVGVNGRLEVLVANDKFTIIRDYAHAPDALEKMLTTMKKFKNGRLITLFGCAGCRDRKKRADMGRIVEENSDFAIITSDNPREEDPMQIINDTIIGMKNSKKHKIIVDRFDAIKWAIDNLQNGDILILAGKGHEDYQVLDFGSVYFNEKELVNQFLTAKSD
ncbi:MAG: UDP-N-acetylmuramoyl-L-alanyl-D-glutamate--2,6-diaminopimelate ligase [Oscillospiraceae bacterium]